jgi:hypothetical protein
LPGHPARIGPYQLVRELGSGGMGRVFLARSAGGLPVAVKVIRADLAGVPEFRARFRHEVAAAGKVNGLYTALVVDADVDGPAPWLATAYVAGPPLADLVRRHGPLPAVQVAVLGAALAEGLGAIHAAGLVHRDLKPSNVLLAQDGPRIIDFGISWAAEVSSLTRSGHIIGSPGFMSPEQAQGGKVGPPSDVFSLGAVLTFVSTGHGPFGAGSAPALGYRVVHASPDLADVPAGLRPLVGRCLAKDPGQRPDVGGLLAGLGDLNVQADWLSSGLAGERARYAPTEVDSAAVPFEGVVPASEAHQNDTVTSPARGTPGGGGPTAAPVTRTAALGGGRSWLTPVTVLAVIAAVAAAALLADLKLNPRNPSPGAGTAASVTTSAPVNTSAPAVSANCTPKVDSVSEFTATQTQTVTIRGSCFGNGAAIVAGDSPSFLITVGRSGWNACNNAINLDLVTCNITKWNDITITFGGFTGPYGDGYVLANGDNVEIQVWNWQSDNGPAICNATVGNAGTTNCNSS